MIDLEPSVPRTPAQAVLRIVSILMAIIGVAVLAGGVALLVANVLGVLSGGDVWTVATFGVIIVVAAGLLILTAALGLAASNNSARVGPYRFLCYLVGLAVLVAIVWGWGVGSFILFNPVVLVTTIVYVLVCSRLADKVKEEHDHGVTGETFLRSRYQRVLHLLSEITILKGVLTAVVTAVLTAALLVYGEGEQATISGMDITVTGATFALMVAGAVSAGINLLVGCLGIWGSNRPSKIRPFLFLAALVTVTDVVRVVVALVTVGLMGVSFDLVLDLLFMVSCTYLAARILRQPSPEELLAQSVGAATVSPADEGADA